MRFVLRTRADRSFPPERFFCKSFYPGPFNQQKATTSRSLSRHRPEIGACTIQLL